MLALVSCLLIGTAQTPIRLQRTATLKPLASDVLLASHDSMGGGIYECSVGTTRPDRQFRNGLAVSIGGPVKAVTVPISTKGISDSKEWLTQDLPAIADMYYGTDNQTVRLVSNVLLMERDSAYAGPFSGRPPKWNQAQITFRDKIGPRIRGVLTFLRSGDNGKTWGDWSMIDFASFEGGKYGMPRPMSDAGAADVGFDKQGKNPDGTPKWWIGGGDRTEVYVCPFTYNVYVATRVISGPYSKTDSQANTTLIMGSLDHGRTWKLLTTIPAWSPTVMTTTKDGRLWLLQEQGSATIVNLSSPVAKGQLPSTFVEKDVSGGVLAEGPAAVDMEAKIGHPSIARLTTGGANAVLLSYQLRNGSGNQLFRIMRVEVNAKGDISSSQVTTIGAEDGKTHSAMYGAFIQPELAGEAASRTTDTTVFYWLEARQSTATKDGAYCAKYCVFRAGKPAETGYLSKKDGKDRKWTTRRDPGDYLKGGSFFDNAEALVFAPVWIDDEGLKTTLLR